MLGPCWPVPSFEFSRYKSSTSAQAFSHQEYGESTTCILSCIILPSPWSACRHAVGTEWKTEISWGVQEHCPCQSWSSLPFEAELKIGTPLWAMFHSARTSYFEIMQSHIFWATEDENEIEKRVNASNNISFVATIQLFTNRSCRILFLILIRSCHMSKYNFLPCILMKCHFPFVCLQKHYADIGCIISMVMPMLGWMPGKMLVVITNSYP